MGKYQKEKDEVGEYLESVKGLIRKGRVTINNKPWKDRANKTLAYMAETGLCQKDIEEIIYELQVADYCYTADDRNEYFKDEQVWIFGTTKDIIDQDIDLYIKLKIRRIREEFLLIMSFHPERPRWDEQKLSFPYKE